MKKIVTIISMIFLSTNLNASQLQGKLSHLNIIMPKKFKLHKNFLGLPYVFIKKEKNSQKTSISVVPTGIQKIDLDPKLLKENYDQYKVGRKNWAKKRKFKIEKFSTFHTFTNSSKARVVSAGYSYENGKGVNNVERSFYILCPGETFQLKLLTERTPKTQFFLESVEKSIKNSTCQRAL